VRKSRTPSPATPPTSMPRICRPWEHRVDGRAGCILHSRREIVDAGKRADSGGARRIVPRFVHAHDNVPALRIGEGDDLPEQVIAGVCREIAAGRPRIRATAITRKISLKFKELALVDSLSGQLSYVCWSNLIRIFVDHL